MSEQSDGVLNLKLLLNLLQIDGPMHEILFWTKLIFLKSISKAISDLVLHVFGRVQEVNLHRIVKYPSNI